MHLKMRFLKCIFKMRLKMHLKTHLKHAFLKCILNAYKMHMKNAFKYAFLKCVLKMHVLNLFLNAFLNAFLNGVSYMNCMKRLLWQMISQKINEIGHIFYLIVVELTFFY